MSVVVNEEMLSKGAPDYILSKSEFAMTKSGKTVPLSKTQKDRI